jgi:DNA-binding HxlR family transcriptional regulator
LFLSHDTELPPTWEEGTLMFPSHEELPSALPSASERATSPTCIVVREILDRVGDKWSVLVISMLGERGLRFSEMRRAIDGISQRMLTLTLRQLERDGIVSRTVHATVPPRVDYALTPLGESVLEPISALMRWAAEHGTDIADARSRYDEAQLAVDREASA